MPFDNVVHSPPLPCRYHLNNNQLVLTINDLKLKLDGQQKEISNLM